MYSKAVESIYPHVASGMVLCPHSDAGTAAPRPATKSVCIRHLHRTVTVRTNNLTLTNTSPEATIPAPATLTVCRSPSTSRGAKTLLSMLQPPRNATTQYGLKLMRRQAPTLPHSHSKIHRSNGAASSSGKNIDNNFGISAFIVKQSLSIHTTAGIVSPDEALARRDRRPSSIIRSLARQPRRQCALTASRFPSLAPRRRPMQRPSATTASDATSCDSAGVLVIQSCTNNRSDSNYVDGNDSASSSLPLQLRLVERQPRGHNSNDGIQLLGASCTCVTGNTVICNGGRRLSVPTATSPSAREASESPPTNVLSDNRIAN